MLLLITRMTADQIGLSPITSINYRYYCLGTWPVEQSFIINTVETKHFFKSFLALQSITRVLSKMEDYSVCSVDISLYFKLPVCAPHRVLRSEALPPVSKFEKIARLLLLQTEEARWLPSVPLPTEI